MSSSSHLTALPDPRAAIRRVINLGRDEKVIRVVYLLDHLDRLDHSVNRMAHHLRLTDSITDSTIASVLASVLDTSEPDELEIDSQLDGLLDGLLVSLLVLVSLLDRDVDGHRKRWQRQGQRQYLGYAVEKAMVRRVRRNPEIAVKILHGLSGNRVVKDVNGDCHFDKGIMSDYEYMVYKYTTNILIEGLFKNEDPIVNLYNVQLCEGEAAMDCVRRFPVAKDNVRLLSNSPDTKTMDAINCRHMLDCAEAELAVAAGLVTRDASRADASRAFRAFVHKYRKNGRRYRVLRQKLQGTNISISDDLLRCMTSLDPNGISTTLRGSGNEAAHCHGKKEGEFEATIKRQPNKLRRCMEELRVVGRNYR